MNAPARAHAPYIAEVEPAGVTWCDACDHVHAETRSQDPWRWRCVKAPTEPGFGFVSQNFSPNPPYELCSRMNTRGECPHFKMKRIPLNEGVNG
jgi:hypothetical protein